MEYGDIMESKIRDYINKLYKTEFIPNVVIKGDLRGNSDGFNGSQILEVKTTSQIHEKVSDYKVYISQMLFYMQLNNVESGILAVYERPTDLSEEFDKERLHIYEINKADFRELEEEIDFQIDRFRQDLLKVKENPFITEEELQPKEIIELSNQLLEFEKELAYYEKIKAKAEELKKQLKVSMQNSGIKKWTTNSGVKITLIPDGEETFTTAFDTETFAQENPELYDRYLCVKKKKGKSGYVRITLPKE